MDQAVDTRRRLVAHVVLQSVACVRIEMNRSVGLTGLLVRDIHEVT